MGHFLFVVLHIIAILFGMVFLIFTIPAHLIYGAISSRNTPTPVQAPQQSAETHRPCPYCKEPILREAIKCRYCGSEVPSGPVRTPSDASVRPPSDAAVSVGRAVGKGVAKGGAGPYVLFVIGVFVVYYLVMWASR